VHKIAATCLVSRSALDTVSRYSFCYHPPHTDY
jgi:hypothetical protein